MYPFFSVLGRQVSTYAFLVVVGILLGSLLASTRRSRYQLPGMDVAFFAAYAAVGTMIGAKLLFLLTQIGNIRLDIMDGIPVRYLLERYLGSGFVFYGGLGGAVAGLWVYARKMKLSFAHALDLFLPVLPLVHAIGRLGCFSAGCCYGIPAQPPLGIAFSRSLSAPNHVHLFPVQLLESLLLFAIFAVLWRYTGKRRTTGQIVSCYLLLYAPARFCLEFLRGDLARGFLFGLSTSQLISLLLFFGLIAYRLCKKGKDLPKSA